MIMVNGIKYYQYCIAGNPTKVFIKSQDPIVSLEDMMNYYDTDINYNGSAIAIDMNNLDLSKCLSLSNMFGEQGYTLESVNLGFIDTSNITNMDYLFYRIMAPININNCIFNTSKVTSLNNMFEKSNIPNIKQIVDRMNTSNVTTMYNCFYESKYKTLDLSNWDTSNVQGMNLMFCNSSIEELPIINTKNCKNFGSLFNNCKELGKNGKLIVKYDFSSATSISSMFQSCTSISEIDLSECNFSKVTKGINSIFSGCLNLKSVKFPTIGNEDSTLSFFESFSGCSNLEYIDFQYTKPPTIGISNALYCSNMFHNCEKLKTIRCTSDFKSFITSNTSKNKLPSTDINWEII